MSASSASPHPARIAPPGESDRLLWINPPHQERSQQTLDRLLDAAEALLQEKSFDELPVAEIARRAHSSVGAFYTRFKDKDGLLQALHDRFCQGAYVTADAALDPERWDGASVSEIVSAVSAFLVQIIGARAGLSRTLQTRVLDPQVRERSQRLGRYVNEGLAQLLLERRDEIRHPDPELACDFACRQLFFALEPLVADAGFDPGRVALSHDEIARELTRSFLAYLGVREPY